MRISKPESAPIRRLARDDSLDPFLTVQWDYPGYSGKFLWLFYTKYFPNGISDNEANFICCLANGIPIIVIAQSIANARCVMAIQIPPTNIQITFIIVDRNPLACSVYRISFPNGTRARTESFIHWIPNGIPIIVKHKSKPESRYSMNRIIPPPRIIQRMFPSKLISPPKLYQTKKISIKQPISFRRWYHLISIQIKVESMTVVKRSQSKMEANQQRKACILCITYQ